MTYVELVNTGDLAEVLSETPKTSRRTAGVNVRVLNTGRCDFGEQRSRMTAWYPKSAVRPADMTRWSYSAVTNRWARQ